MESLELAHMLVDAILDKKGSDIVLLDISEQSVFASYFLICTAENSRQLQALANSIASDAKKDANVLPLSSEGAAESGWVLVDFGDLVIHIFSPEKRTYYQLEELWGEGQLLLRMQ